MANPGIKGTREQRIQSAPRGWKIRRKVVGSHTIALGYPGGKKNKGSGKLLSIFHPQTERNPECGEALALMYRRMKVVIPDEEEFDNGFDAALGFGADFGGADALQGMFEDPGQDFGAAKIDTDDVFRFAAGFGHINAD